MTTLRVETHSAEEAKAVGVALASILVGGDLIDLRGELGAGKTTTTVGLAAGLGATTTVRSPTFTFIHHHRLAGEAEELLHVDLYRIDDVGELEGLGLFDLMDDSTITVIEWMERGGDELPRATIVVELAQTGPSSRDVAVFVDEVRASALLRAFVDAGFAVAAGGAP